MGAAGDLVGSKLDPPAIIRVILILLFDHFAHLTQSKILKRSCQLFSMKRIALRPRWVLHLDQIFQHQIDRDVRDRPL